MTQSKHRTFGFWFPAALLILFMLLLISSISQYYFGYRILKMQINNDKQFLIQCLLALFGIMIMISLLWHNVKNIIVDNLSKTISFQNIFSRKIKEYNFSDFDGFIDTYIKHGKGGYSHRAIGFVKGRKIIRRIDSYYYSNYDEIRTELTNCNYMGEIRFGFWDSLKMLLNYNVLK